jgi:hypothetical protein
MDHSDDLLPKHSAVGPVSGAALLGRLARPATSPRIPHIPAGINADAPSPPQGGGITSTGNLARVSEPASRRLGRLAARGSRLPSERDWERSAVLEPRSAPRQPELISDGGGLPFPPAALASSLGLLDPEDPAVGALIAQITARTAAKRASRAPWKRDAATRPAPPSLDGWRMLARTDGEVLFARGRPPELFTVAVRRDARRRTWSCSGTSAARPLRATRDGIRASSWRMDPTHELEPDETVLRVLVTEQTFAGGQRAAGRVLPPDLHVDADELVLTMFVTPQPGFQPRSPNPETPVRIALPHPVGVRRLVDGALYQTTLQVPASTDDVAEGDSS